ncbi:MAG: hypothetical protein RLN62_05695 [Rickettsiales bacterium]
MNLYGMLTGSWSSAPDMYKKIEDAIQRGDLEEVRTTAHFIDVNGFKLGIGHHQPVFFSLLNNQTEIADMLVEEFNGSVDYKYPSYSMYKNKCPIEVALPLTAKGCFQEENLAKLNSYSKGPCFYPAVLTAEIDDKTGKEVAAPEMTLGKQKCAHEGQEISCAAVPKECYASNRPLECSNYDVRAFSIETTFYNFTYNEAANFTFTGWHNQEDITEGIDIFNLLGVKSSDEIPSEAIDDNFESEEHHNEGSSLRGVAKQPEDIS